MNNEIKVTVVSRKDTEQIISCDYIRYISFIEDVFNKRVQNKIILPDKISQIFDEEIQNRINCMPATILDENVSGVKWVSVFPNNPKSGRYNVIGQIILSELEYGYPLAYMDGTYLTAFRTAAVGSIASKYLAKKECHNIGFIGSGMQAIMHFILIKLIHPEIETCFVASQADGTEEKFVLSLADKYKDVEFIMCNSCFERAVKDSDIIVTATSTQAALLKADWIKKGTLYIHVGGWEDEYKVPQLADKIICDEWEAVKHRTQTISRMYQEGILKDSDIYCNIGDIISGKIVGRKNDDDFIYFNSVGLGYVDIYVAYQIYNDAKKIGLGKTVEL